MARTRRAVASIWILLPALFACAAARPSTGGDPAPPAAATAKGPETAAAPAPNPYLSSEPIQPITARFEMPSLARPAFPDRSFDIRAHGAVEGGTAKNTQAFRHAVLAAAGAGGGTVLVPAGRWLTGPIRLESNVNLHLAAGAVLLFSQDFGDYLPPVFTRWEGL